MLLKIAMTSVLKEKKHMKLSRTPLKITRGIRKIWPTHLFSGSISFVFEKHGSQFCQLKINKLDSSTLELSTFLIFGFL